MTHFSDLGLNPQLVRACDDQGYSTPTDIQEKAIPLLLKGHDVLGIAQTGTGKTAAYALPILMQCKYAQGSNPRALILAPTRELVIQIEEVFRSLSKYTDLRILAIYGGLGPRTQIDAINNGIDLLIATPGRFMELYLKEVIITKELKTLVLDEADKMMDMGFMPQIRKILEVIPIKKRQNALFSATFPEKVENLSFEFLEYPHKIEITPQATTAVNVEQCAYDVPNLKTKLAALKYFLEQEGFDRVMVFCRSKLVANDLEQYLLENLLKEKDIRVIHSNKGQNTRINSMNLFREGKLKVLVTTDVTARGIDIPLVSHVINFDVPLIYEDYVHRIGRTGRADALGASITFVTMAEKYHWEKIEKIIQQTIPLGSLPNEIPVFATPKEEEIAMLRAIDEQKRKENPDFKGAFHEKKSKPQKKNAKFKSKSNKSNKRRK
ncbi:DEAD/DEAH box helicase [Sandaracinomonas limnophila]|uniref:DEAD/DEAH box helicase n=1 Tax=Sandaracinomonas limnophila TaxID=1862386 RepID=A0A437PPL0_9BACT|nr:DEAD/DEAH box helicase [Sandaracinomonas limnophila]RVU24225.1 DEAD/DEAH box helicase [Sandaracinomonas limnophila]